MNETLATERMAVDVGPLGTFGEFGDSALQLPLQPATPPA